jgi:single-strand DNA-binding protein
MNVVNLIGNFTADPDVRNANGKTVTRMTLAVNRKFKNAEGRYDADFISCVAFDKNAEFIEKYFRKGMKIGVTGHIQTGSYTNRDGQKVYTTDVIVDSSEFVERQSQQSNEPAAPRDNTNNATDNDGFMNIPEGIDEELPFV